MRRNPDPRLLDLAKSLGVATTRDVNRCVVWSGRSIALHLIYDGNDGDSNLAHELGHYVVCDPERRTKKDYGLGPGPESLATVPRLMSDTEAISEEVHASATGILIEAAFDLSWRRTLDTHAWKNFDSLRIAVAAIESNVNKKRIDVPGIYGVLAKGYRTIWPSGSGWRNR